VTLEGALERFTFRNPDTGFAVCRFVPDRGAGPITIVGHLAQLAEGQQLEIEGVERTHARFGTQIEVTRFTSVLPSTVDGIVAYLSSHLVKGIGPATAQRIVDAFGADTLRIVESEPERLREVKGLGRKRIDELVTAVRSQKDVQDLMVFLRTHGLGQGLANRIARRYGKGAAALVMADPYRLADEVLGIGFKTADRIAASLGIQATAPERIRGGLLHVLGQAAKEGHCFLPEPVLLQRTAALLQCDEAVIGVEIAELAIQHRIAREHPPGPRALVENAPLSVYPVALHAAERGVADALDRLVAAPTRPLPIDVDRALAWFETQSGMRLPTGQREALQWAFRSNVSVITGGPGVGKTTIVRALAEILAQKSMTLRLAAPTGRAAKRLEESTQRAASTIHRLLEYQAGVHRFQRDATTPLDGDMLVVDEASMLDVQLAYYLLRAVPLGMRVVFVGDVHQLPAVGPGHVLGDVIASGRVPVTPLTEIFRQQEGSAIVAAAHAVLRGEEPTSSGEGGDFFVVDGKSPAHTRALVRELVVHRIPKRFGMDPRRDIQVLCPMYRGDAGADAINRDLQDVLNPGAQELERGGKRFRVGDRVMQVRNDYEQDVFNGDVGRILDLDRANARARLRFGEREIDVPFTELDQVVPAYAISVHRSQGSEYPAVVMPLASDHFLMLRRNLLYTAITRGRRLVVLVGSRKAMATAIRNTDEADRFTNLTQRLRERLRDH
jgi:exodeoxyribonuclease V alpha subunit